MFSGCFYALPAPMLIPLGNTRRRHHRGAGGRRRRRRLVSCWRFMPCLYLRSYQDGHRLITVYFHVDFIVLPHWETGKISTRLRAQAASTMSSYITQSHLDTDPMNPYPILRMTSAWLGSDKYAFMCNWIDSTRV